MTDVEELAAAVIDGLDDDPGVKEFKRTIQHDDGSTETYRVDIIAQDEASFTAATLRQWGDRSRKENGPARFARSDREGFARWLGENPWTASV